MWLCWGQGQKTWVPPRVAGPRARASQASRLEGGGGRAAAGLGEALAAGLGRKGACGGGRSRAGSTQQPAAAPGLSAHASTRRSRSPRPLGSCAAWWTLACAVLLGGRGGVHLPMTGSAAAEGTVQSLLPLKDQKVPGSTGPPPPPSGSAAHQGPLSSPLPCIHPEAVSREIPAWRTRSPWPAGWRGSVAPTRPSVLSTFSWDTCPWALQRLETWWSLVSVEHHRLGEASLPDHPPRALPDCSAQDT